MASKQPLLGDDRNSDKILEKMHNIEDNWETYKQKEYKRAKNEIISVAGKADSNADETDEMAEDLLQHQSTNRSLFTKKSKKKRYTSMSCWDNFIACICCKK